MGENNKSSSGDMLLGCGVLVIMAIGAALGIRWVYAQIFGSGVWSWVLAFLTLIAVVGIILIGAGSKAQKSREQSLGPNRQPVRPMQDQYTREDRKENRNNRRRRREQRKKEGTNAKLKEKPVFGPDRKKMARRIEERLIRDFGAGSLRFPIGIEQYIEDYQPPLGMTNFEASVETSYRAVAYGVRSVPSVKEAEEMDAAAISVMRSKDSPKTISPPDAALPATDRTWSDLQKKINARLSEMRMALAKFSQEMDLLVPRAINRYLHFLPENQRPPLALKEIRDELVGDYGFRNNLEDEALNNYLFDNFGGYISSDRLSEMTDFVIEESVRLIKEYHERLSVQLLTLRQEIEELENQALAVETQPLDAPELKKLIKSWQHRTLRARQKSKRTGAGRGVKPAPVTINTWQEAEANACRWMHYFGFTDAKITGGGKDGGIDVMAEGAIAQVKAEAHKTGNRVILQIAGNGNDPQHYQKRKMVFSTSGFTQNALEIADRVDVSLFSFDGFGYVTPCNASARSIMGTHE